MGTILRSGTTTCISRTIIGTGLQVVSKCPQYPCFYLSFTHLWSLKSIVFTLKGKSRFGHQGSGNVLHLENHTRYRPANGVKMSAIPIFIFNFHSFMGLKVNSFDVKNKKSKKCLFSLNFDHEDLLRKIVTMAHCFQHKIWV